MRLIITLFGFAIGGLFACQSKSNQAESQGGIKAPPSANNSQTASIEKTTGSAALRKLFDTKSFDPVHAKHVAKLTAAEKQAVAKRWGTYRVLDVCRGKILKGDSAGAATVLYDDERGQLVLALWDEQAQRMLEVGADVAIEDFSGDTERCHFFSKANSRGQLQERVEEYPPGDKEIADWQLLKCTTKNDDSDLQVDFGCEFGKDAKALNPAWLCLSTSLQYNNWDCYGYDRAQKKLRIVYAQATAD